VTKDNHVRNDNKRGSHGNSPLPSTTLDFYTAAVDVKLHKQSCRNPIVAKQYLFVI